ncbi:MAG TPA: glutaredoxin family protein [Burkholderiales bacterium]|nr:glutaredoxin family protein [Burkholderiales bacterium]
MSNDGNPAPARLTLYSRAYCHLCHDMEAALRRLQAEQPFELEVLDVDADPALEARFNELVPVLMEGERELARYHLDVAALRAELARPGR